MRNTRTGKILCCLLLFISFAKAQVGINTATPRASLDITAQTPTGTTTDPEGLLIPRVDRKRAQSMRNVVPSTLVYINDISTGAASGTTQAVTSVGYYYFDGTQWTSLTVSTTSATNWLLTGNSGTEPGTHFLGTHDNKPLIFKNNNKQSGWLGDATNISFGLEALPVSSTGDFNTAVGVSSLSGNTTGSKNTAIGNTTLSLLATGNSNTAIGYNAGGLLTSGSSNILIGAHTNVPDKSADNQMNIGNIIFGNHITGTLKAPDGHIGIGNNSPTHRLHITAASDPLRVEGLQTGDLTTEEILTINPKGIVKKGRLPGSPPQPAVAIFSLSKDIHNFTKNATSTSASSQLIVGLQTLKNNIQGLHCDTFSAVTLPAGTYQITFTYDARHHQKGCTVSAYTLNIPIGASDFHEIQSTAPHNEGNHSDHSGTITFVTTLPNQRTWNLFLGRGKSGNCYGTGNTLKKNSTQLIIHRLGD